MNTKLRKIGKNAKALSPVVASIILIAVTVAVSIAVAAWMGALVVGQMSTTSVTVTNVAFGGASGVANNTIVVSLKNTGTKAVTIAQVKINNLQKPITGVASIAAQGTSSLTIYMNTDDTHPDSWVNGGTYKIDLFDGSNQVMGSYQATGPS